MNLSITITEDYGDKTAFRRIKNKANSNPIKTILCLIVSTNKSITILPVLTHKPIVNQSLFTHVYLIELIEVIDRMTNIYLQKVHFGKVIL